MCVGGGGGGGGGGDLPFVSVYKTLLQGHFYLLCTVMVSYSKFGS